MTAISTSSALFEQALVLWNQQQFSAAYPLLRDALTANDASTSPVQGETHHLLALYFALQRQPLAAEPHFIAAGQLIDSVQLHHNWGNFLIESNRWDEAPKHFFRALQTTAITAFEQAQNHWQLARCQLKAGQIESAYGHLQQTEALLTDELDWWRKLARTYDDILDYVASSRIYQQILLRFPNERYGYNGLANALSNVGQRSKAIEVFEQGIAQFPDDFVLHTNLACAYNYLGAQPQAQQSSQRALELAPHDAEVLYNHGTILEAQRLYSDAADTYLAALHLKPNFAEAHFALATHHLRHGNWLAGWHGYEWRWQQKDAKNPPFATDQLWRGEKEIKGTRLFIHVEQGFGDIIQFSRLIAKAKQQSKAHITFNPPRELWPLMEPLLLPSSGVDALHPWDQEPPQFDWHCPLLSLPLALNLQLKDIPAGVPYLQPSTKSQEFWRQQLLPLQSSKKLGITWCGNPEFRTDSARSMRLSTLTPLIELCAARGVTVFSLQKFVPENDRDLFARWCDRGLFIDFSRSFESFDDTAALIDQLEHIFSVDTAIAHLAGALNRPTTIPLPYAACWRWLLDRQDSPWYPSVHLIRQPIRNDWASVIDQFCDNFPL